LKFLSSCGLRPRYFANKSGSLNALLAVFPLLLLPQPPDLGLSTLMFNFSQRVAWILTFCSAHTFLSAGDLICPFLIGSRYEICKHNSRSLIQACGGLMPYYSDVLMGTNFLSFMFEMLLNNFGVAWHIGQDCIDFVAVMILSTLPSINVIDKRKCIRI